MPLINLNLPNIDLNTSCQIGDTAYYISTSTTAEFDVNATSVIEIGVITDITISGPDVVLEINTSLPASLYPNTGDYIFFSKDNKANMSSMLGYYAKIQMKNDSKDKSELFKVNADYSESSK